MGAVPKGVARMESMISDVMARWMAETGQGSIRELRSRLAWMARTAGAVTPPAETGRWLRDLSSLAHAELDWGNDRWASAPLVVTRIPGPDGLALVAGARSHAADTGLDELAVEVHRVAQPRADGL